MNANDRPDNRPQQQTAENPSGDAVQNPFENGQSSKKDIEQANDKLEQEQTFKEAQSERD